jgi:hypothetical protein
MGSETAAAASTAAADDELGLTPPSPAAGSAPQLAAPSVVSDIDTDAAKWLLERGITPLATLQLLAVRSWSHALVRSTNFASHASSMQHAYIPMIAAAAAEGKGSEAFKAFDRFIHAAEIVEAHDKSTLLVWKLV